MSKSILTNNEIHNIELASYPEPVAEFTPQDLLLCEAKDSLIYFYDISEIPNKDIYEEHTTDTVAITQQQWILDLNNPNIQATGPFTSTNIYQANNNTVTEYYTQLTVTTNHGCSDSTIGQVTILPTPIPYFGPYDV